MIFINYSVIFQSEIMYEFKVFVKDFLILSEPFGAFLE